MPSPFDRKCARAGARAIRILVGFVCLLCPGLLTATPPTATRQSPSNQNVTIFVGTNQQFVVKGTDPDGNLRGAEWYLNGSHQVSHFNMSGSVDYDTWARTFSSPGDYVVEALVFDQLGEYSGPATWNVHVVSNSPPTATRQSPSNQSITIQVGTNQRFVVKGTDPDGNLRGAEWYLDGNHQVSHFNMTGSVDYDTWTRTFNSPGDYEVAVLVFDQLSAYSDPATWTVHVVSNSPPTATRHSPSSQNITILVGTNQQFVVKGTDPDGNLRGAEWYLDGNHQVSHFNMTGSVDYDTWGRVFGSPGDYEVIAMVFDQQNAYSGPATWNVHVVSNSPPTAARYSPSAESLTVFVGMAQRFIVRGSDPDGNLRGTEWYLSGNHQVSHFNMSGSVDYDTWSYTFSNLGSFEVAALVFDEQGAYSDPARWYVRVVPRAPQCRHMWEWDTDYLISTPRLINLFLGFCAAPYGNPSNAITKVYVEAYGATANPVNPLLRSFIRTARQSGIDIHALGGDPSWATNHNAAFAFVNRILEYNRQCPDTLQRFRGVHFDVECDTQYIDDYVSLLSGLKAHSHNGQSMNSQRLALGVDTRFGWEEGNLHYTSQILGVPDIDFISVMAYRDTALGGNGIVAVSQDEVAAANSIAKSCVIGVETQRPGGQPEYVTFWEEGNTYMEVQLTAVRARYASEPSFGGFAIHDFESYYAWVPPTASFSANPRSGYVPLTVGFSDSSAGPWTWRWSFGDGDTSRLSDPAHTYRAPGSYTVTLIADNYSGSDTLQRPDYIQALLVGVDERELTQPAPLDFALQACIPGPVGQGAILRYSIPLACHVSLRIYTSTGRVAATIVRSHQQPGTYSVSWDGRDDHRGTLPAGTYFCRLEAGEFTATRKMVKAE